MLPRFSRASIEKISARFSLPIKGDEQDWECHVADGDRLEEFMRAYDEPSLSSEDRAALMSLVLMSADDCVSAGRSPPPAWDAIVATLGRDRVLHRLLLDYWARWDESEPENWFWLTPLVRGQIDKKERILAAAARMMRSHDATLRKLAR